MVCERRVTLKEMRDGYVKRLSTGTRNGGTVRFTGLRATFVLRAIPRPLTSSGSQVRRAKRGQDERPNAAGWLVAGRRWQVA